MKKLLILTMLVVLMVGCVATLDPVTGEKEYAAKESIVTATDAVVTTVEAVGPAVVAATTAINPVAGGIAGTVFGIMLSLFACYKKWRVPLVESGVMLDKVTAGLRAAGDVIDDVVKPNVDLWSKAKPLLKLAEKNGSVNADMLPKIV